MFTCKFKSLTQKESCLPKKKKTPISATFFSGGYPRRGGGGGEERNLQEFFSSSPLKDHQRAKNRKIVFFIFKDNCFEGQESLALKSSKFSGGSASNAYCGPVAGFWAPGAPPTYAPTPAALTGKTEKDSHHGELGAGSTWGGGGAIGGNHLRAPWCLYVGS